MERTSSRALFALVMTLALVAGSCGGGGADSRPPAEQAAIDQAVAALVDSGFNEGAAQCYAGGLVDAFGLDALATIGAGGAVSADVSATVAQLLIDCGIFGAPSGTTFGDYRDLASPPDQVDGPYGYGDDAELDALWDRCAAGSGDACDSLFYAAPVGSLYEAFGTTCGNRPDLDYDCSKLGG